MESKNLGTATETVVGIIWLVLVGGTLFAIGFIAWALAGTWSYFPRMLARGALLTFGPILLSALLMGLVNLFEYNWTTGRTPIGSGWLAKLVSSIFIVFSVFVLASEEYPGIQGALEAIRCLTFSLVALLASPSIERRARQCVVTVLTALVLAYVIVLAIELAGHDAPNAWMGLLVAPVSSLGYALQIAIATGLCAWTRRRLEARKEKQVMVGSV